MHRCLLISAQGEATVLSLEHGTAHTFLGGPVGFVGAIDALNAVAIGRRDDDGEVNAVCAKLPHWFYTDTRGQVLLVGSDEAGAACDLDVEAVLRAIRAATVP